ncbi:Neuroglian [Carabus blaptoides fortunei]
MCICRKSCALRQLVPYPPRIVKQPPTDELLLQVAVQNNENPKPFFIECEAEGEPTPQFKWIKNGKDFDWEAYDHRITRQPGRGTLIISEPRDEDLGLYQCFAYNVWGKATSNSVFVRKAELPSFKDAAHMLQTVNEGEPFKLTCEPPNAWPKPNVNWIIQYKDGGIKSINNSRMTVDPEGNLWFSNVTRNDESDDFYFACAATSEFSHDYKLGNKVAFSVITNGITPSLIRQAPIKQYVSSKNERALRGKKFELYCIYGGSPLPQIVWSKDGKIVQSSDRITYGNYGKSIIIKEVTFDDEGNYTCVASNGVGSEDSYSINLQVLAAPYFTVEPQIKIAAEDETVEFKCEASGVPEPQIKWIHNGKPISEAPPNPRRKVSTNSIVIENLERTDIGNYGCNASNSLGYVYKDVFLNVLALAPEITEPLRDMNTVDHKTIIMKCRVFGVPKPRVEWYRSGKKLTGGRYEVWNNGDLQIQNVQFSDAGEYTCYASNKFGQVEASTSLRVKEHTRITDAPEDYEVALGSRATFRCNAVSDITLTLQIYWLKDGQIIDLESDPRFICSSDYSLTIFKTTKLDSGMYMCVAKTELDEATALATLVVQDVPNAPELQGVTCNKNDATIRWRPVGDNRAPILHYIIFYNTSFTPNTWEVAYDSVPPYEQTYNVPLTPWANYTFRVVARNKIGKSLASVHSTVCTTQPDVPFKNPEHIEGKGTEPNNLVITWNVMPQIEHGGPKFRYRIFFKRDIPGEQYSVVDILDWKQTKYTVNDQPTFKRYRIKVVAVNELGEANVAPNEVIGYSGEDVPLEAPSNFTLARVLAPTKALFSWNPVSPESIRGHFNGYKIETWIDNDKFNSDPYNSDTNHREIVVNGDVTSVVVSKFVPHTKNYARVFVFNGRYNGPPSQILSFETPEGVPAPVASMEAIPMGSSAFFLSWKKPVQSNGILTGYNIYYQEVNCTRVLDMMSRLPQINRPDVFSAKLSGLKPDTKYRLHVKATTKAGEGESHFIERKTRVSGDHVPDVPTFTWSQLPTENGLATIKVVWVVNPNQNPGSHFYVKYRVQGEPTFQSTKSEFNENFMKIHGLTPNEDYEFKVVAADSSHETESVIEQLVKIR